MAPFFRFAKNPPTHANRFERAFLFVEIRIRGIAGGIRRGAIINVHSDIRIVH